MLRFRIVYECIIHEHGINEIVQVLKDHNIMKLTIIIIQFMELSKVFLDGRIVKLPLTHKKLQQTIQTI